MPGIHRERWAHEHEQRRVQEPPEGRWQRERGVVLRGSDSWKRNVREYGNEWFGRDSELPTGRQAFLGTTDVHPGGTTGLDPRLGPHVDIHPGGATGLDPRLGPHVHLHASGTTDVDAFRKAIGQETHDSALATHLE
jgi:hypothetical protein